MRYAHSIPDMAPENWQPLAVHLENVANLAAAFASKFDSSEWGRIAGQLHDLGKASDAFQAYLLKSNGLDTSDYDAGGPSNHSGAGAVWAIEQFGPIGRIFSYLVAGHHAGLADWVSGENPAGALSVRLQSAVNELAFAREKVADFWQTVPLPPPPRLEKNVDAHLWLRMLYSCLVDADFLDTEAFMAPDVARMRGGFPPLASLLDGFTVYLDEKQKTATKSEVNTIRAEIRGYCQQRATDAPGLFSMTVPTGGGKTLSGTEFALRHAVHHGKNRIIYVIPYTSIIEQTADVLRACLGECNVIEHHSNLIADSQSKAARLATENWDAPIVVTTNVQFFESLLANRSSRCRKLHNIVNSVVILDEVQLLPPELLEPVTDMIRQLTERYGVTFVLSTATQPALPNLDVRELIPPEARLSERLKRVDYALPDIRTAVAVTWGDMAETLQVHPQVLCVVNTRRDCLELYQGMPEGTIHLSATMCGAHRSQVIRTIKEKLSNGENVRVISTQLVEAGVDIDFPVVYRALAGMDSIAQSAGRCNREGKQDKGQVVVFVPPKPAPKGLLRKGEDTTRAMLLAGPQNLHDDVFQRYFKMFYSRVEQRFPYQALLVNDARQFQFQFRDAARLFNMIDAPQKAVLVGYEKGAALIAELRMCLQRGIPFGAVMRKLQRYSVTMPTSMAERLRNEGLIEVLADDIHIWHGEYSSETGADIFNKDGLLSPEQLVL